MRKGIFRKQSKKFENKQHFAIYNPFKVTNGYSGCMAGREGKAHEKVDRPFEFCLIDTRQANTHMSRGHQ